MIDTEKAEYESVIQKLTMALEQLAAENARLRSESDGAHDVLRRIYLDEATPSGVRVKAAQAALNVEKPRLQPVPPPLDLVAEEYEPLSVVVERQRARANRLLSLSLEERAAMISGCSKGDGNGSDDSEHS